MLTVDIHNHFAPTETIAGALAGDGLDGLRVEARDGREYMVQRQGLRWPIEPTFYDPEARLSAMDDRGAHQAVLSLAPTLLMYWLADASAATDFTRHSLGEQCPRAGRAVGAGERVDQSW